MTGNENAQLVAAEIEPGDSMREAIIAAATTCDQAFMVMHQVNAWRERYHALPGKHTAAYTANPVYPARAWALCCHYKLPAPEWVVRWINGLIEGRHRPPTADHRRRAERLDLAAQLADRGYVPAKRFSPQHGSRVAPPDASRVTPQRAKTENAALDATADADAGGVNRNTTAQVREMGRTLNLRLGRFEIADPVALHRIVGP